MSEIGTVTRVRVDGDSGRVLVDVSMSPTREREDILFRTPARGMWIMPRVGDTVEVTSVGAKNRVAHSPLSTPGQAPPSDMSEGDIVVRLDDGTELSFERTGDGGYDVSVSASGELRLDAASIRVGSDGSTKPVLTEDAVFEYEQRVDTSDGSGGTTTKETTTVSNGESTDAQIE